MHLRFAPETSLPVSPEISVRSIFISDVHLGCRFSQIESVIDLLERLSPDFIFLVGDFIDVRQLCRRWHWPPRYHYLFELIEGHTNRGTQVVYTPGNHDHFLRNASLRKSTAESRIHLCDQYVHRLADGRRMLVLHGDQFDRIEKNAGWLSHMGTAIYETLMLVDRRLNRFLLRFMRRRVPVSRSLKQLTKRTVLWFSNSKQKIIDYASENQCDVIVCGHTHIPEELQRGEVTYYNCGDWIENATVLIESHDGSLELRRWSPATQSPVVPRRIDGERLNHVANIEVFVMNAIQQWADSWSEELATTTMSNT